MAADSSGGDFDQRAGRMLQHLADVLDDGLGAVADVDFSGGILTVTLDAGGQYVVNRHGPNREIWLSSPKSGASHYAFDETRGAWVGTRSGRALTEVLAEDLGITLD